MRWFILPLLVAALSSCGTLDFYAQAVGGQAEVLLKRRPVSAMLGEEGTDPALRRQLELSRRLLDFAESELAMPSGGSYTLYTHLGRDHLVWVIHAAPELSLEPKRWWYPVVGKQDYRGYFDERRARVEEGRLRRRGYETWASGVDAYSTLGVFRDPLLDTFIHRDEADLAELIFHELVHQKHYVRGDTKFNEGMAEAVAREGVRRWFRSTGRTAELARYELRLNRLARAGRAIRGCSDRLREIYASGVPDGTKRRLKAGEIARLRERLRALRGEWGGGLDSWIDGPINNARLNSFTTYEDEVPRFVRLIGECGGDFPRFWERVKEIAR